MSIHLPISRETGEDFLLYREHRFSKKAFTNLLPISAPLEVPTPLVEFIWLTTGG